MALTLPTSTGYSGFWNNTGPSGVSGAGPYAPKYGRANEEYRAAIMINKRGNRKWRAIMRALNGVVPGSSAVDTYVRVLAVQGDSQFQGGKRTMQTVTNTTTTTAAHVTAINARLYDQMNVTQPYPVDLSGNGGGGKRGR